MCGRQQLHCWQVISFPCKNPCKIYNARNNISLRNCVVVMFITKRHFMVVVEICVHESLNINNSILCNSLQRSSYCKIYMGQSELVKVGKPFFTKSNNLVQFSKCLPLLSQECEQVASETGFLLPHTRSSHLTYCHLPRGIFFF